MARVRLADAFGHNYRADVVTCRGVTYVCYVKGHDVFARTLLVVAEFQFGLVERLARILVVGGYIRRRLIGMFDVDKACTLLSYRIGKAVFVHNDIRGGHHKFVDDSRYFERSDIFTELAALDVLTDKRRSARLVGASHGSTGKSVVTLTGNGR